MDNNTRVTESDAEGQRPAFRVEGSGIPCLSIGSTTSWPGATLSDTLKQKIKFVFADSRFIGSPRPAEVVQGITWQTFFDDIECVRREVGEERMVVLGHSAIGLLALEYAKAYPQNVTHVIMLATPPRGTLDTSTLEPEFIPELKRFWENDASEERKALLRRNQSELTPERMAATPPGKAFGIWYIAHAPMLFSDPNYDVSWLFEPLEFDAGVYAHYVGSLLKDYDVAKSLRETPVPVFLALGRYDYGVPYVMWDEVRTASPNLTTVMFEKSGHYPMMEEPERFDRELLAWLQAE